MSAGRRAIAAAAALCLSGCGSVQTLDRTQQLQARGDYAAIAGEPVPPECTQAPASDACAKLNAIRGHACLTLARSRAAPDAACPPADDGQATRWLACAVNNFARAGASGLSQEEAANLHENRARALYCSAHLHGMESGSAQQGAAMARAALHELAGLQPSPARDHLAASSALFIAQQTQLPDGERCTAAHEAERLAVRGLNQVKPDTTTLAGSLIATRSGATQEAGVIPACK